MDHCHEGVTWSICSDLNALKVPPAKLPSVWGQLVQQLESKEHSSNLSVSNCQSCIQTSPYLASKHKWDGAVGACYFTVAQHWRKAIQVFDAGRHSLCAGALQSISDWGAGQLLPLALAAACSWRAPSSLDSVRGRGSRSGDVMPSSSEPLSVKSTALPSYIFSFAWLDRPDRLKCSRRELHLRELWRSHAGLPWPGGVPVGEGGLEGSRVRRVSCHNAQDSARSISAAVLPPAAEEPEESEERGAGSDALLLNYPNKMRRAAQRERGEASRLEGEGWTVTLSLLHSSLERNWRVSEPKVAACRPGEGDKKLSGSFGGETGGSGECFLNRLTITRTTEERR